MELAHAVSVLVGNECVRTSPILDVQSLRNMFPEDASRAFWAGIKRLTDAGLLRRLGRGIYRNMAGDAPFAGDVGRIATLQRPGALSYMSLESAASEWGFIRPIPQYTAMMTTGRSGRFDLADSTIEFIHTARTQQEIVARTWWHAERQMRLAEPELVLSDMKRTRRGVGLVDRDDYHDAVAAYRANNMREATPTALDDGSPNRTARRVVR